jgi:anti-sigma28 factor (negative regulator of flagellin synthesis)
MRKKPITNIAIAAEIDSLPNNIPDTQEDIISELREDIICGKYNMNPEKIVGGILWHGVHALRMSERLH